MNRVVRIHEQGGPEVLRIEQAEVPTPGQGELLIRNAAIGVNFLETYIRSGLYPSAMPTTLGSDSVGVVEAVGAGVDGFVPGNRVFCTGGAMNAYADYRIGLAEKSLLLPPGIPDIEAAALVLKGMTAQFLVRRVAQIKPGDPVLVLAAAGGVGSIMCQWLKALGALVIGGVGSNEKMAAARENGCDHVILTSDPQFSKAVRAIIGEGVAVVYDSIGKDTFAESLNCLRKFGLMVCSGNASGIVPPIDIGVLAEKGSLYLTRPGFPAYISNRAEFETAAGELFELHSSGKLHLPVRHVYDFEDVATAHRDLESRATTGLVALKV